VGRKANVGSLDVETVGIKLAKGGHIEVDGNFQTSVPGIYAAGDVIGPPSLASTGVYQAQHAVLAMFGEEQRDAHVSYPVGMWTTPECSYYGMTKDAAEKTQKYPQGVEEGIAPYSSCLRGRVFAPEGLLKLVFEKTSGVILGVHIVGENACELVHYGMDIVDQSVTIFSVMSTLFIAVTFHELFKEAAVNGNSKLSFGVQWHEIFKELKLAYEKNARWPEISKSFATTNLLQEEFALVDTAGKGTVDAQGLTTVLGKLGLEMKSEVIEDLVFLADEDGSCSIAPTKLAEIFQQSMAFAVAPSGDQPFTPRSRVA